MSDGNVIPCPEGERNTNPDRNIGYNQWGLPNNLGPGEGWGEQSPVNPFWWRNKTFTGTSTEWTCVHCYNPGECPYPSCEGGPHHPLIREGEVEQTVSQLQQLLEAMEDQCPKTKTPRPSTKLYFHG